MEGRKYRRRKIILIYELIETHISVGMLEISEKEKATQSSILAWEMPWAEEPGGLQSLGSQRVRHNLATKPISHSLNSRVYHAMLHLKNIFILMFA